MCVSNWIKGQSNFFWWKMVFRHFYLLTSNRSIILFFATVIVLIKDNLLTYSVMRELWKVVTSIEMPSQKKLSKPFVIKVLSKYSTMKISWILFVVGFVKFESCYSKLTWLYRESLPYMEKHVRLLAFITFAQSTIWWYDLIHNPLLTRIHLKVSPLIFIQNVENFHCDNLWQKNGMKCVACWRLAKRLKDDNDFISVDAHANKLC